MERNHIVSIMGFLQKLLDANISPKAFSDKNYPYYILQKDMPLLDKGAVFYYDEHDSYKGSIGAGCLKLCWTPEGGCYGNSRAQVCAGTVVLHACARFDKSWFKKYK